MGDWFPNPFKKRRTGDMHTEVRAHASDYIDGELDEEAAEKVIVHLDKCHLCRAFFDTLRATIGLLGAAKGPGAPPTFRERLMQRLRKERA